MPVSKTRTASDALIGLWAVALTSFIVATLFFARDVIIPIALALLLTFLLAPLVTRLERWFGRIAAVLVVVALIFGAVGGAGYVLTRQVIDLGAKLPDYKDNIQTKLRAFQTKEGGMFSRFTATVEELKKDLPGAEKPEPAVTAKPGASESAQAAPPAPPTPAVPVKVVETSRAPMDFVQPVIAPLLGPVGTGLLVVLLLIFMLLQREDLRNRLIRLMG